MLTVTGKDKCEERHTCTSGKRLAGYCPRSLPDWHLFTAPTVKISASALMAQNPNHFTVSMAELIHKPVNLQ